MKKANSTQTRKKSKPIADVSAAELTLQRFGQFSRDEVYDKLSSYFGFSGFKGTQEDVIRSILSGKDTFVIMPTGGGKSMCYQLPALLLDGFAIVVSPLIALMKNQVDLLRGYTDKNATAHFFNSSLSKVQEKEVRADLLAGHTKILYIAPETLVKEDNIAFFKKLPISFFAVDEAHCISEWGHDFRPEYRKIHDMFRHIDKSKPILALTATATPKVQNDIIKTLALDHPNVFLDSFNRPNLYYEVIPKIKKEQTFKHIIQFIQSKKRSSGIIYTTNRKTTEDIAEILCANSIKAVAYHAGIDTKQRNKRQDDFLNEKVQVMVATIAFGMGIDKPDIRFVIHFNLPKSIENYYQETGRAGRDGLLGECLLLYAKRDVHKIEFLLKDKPVSEREVALQLLQETISYAETGLCRRRFLLHYFGEMREEEHCGNCDNCKNPKQRVEAQEEAVIALRAVKALGEHFSAPYVIDFVMGAATSQIQMYRHHTHKSFGAGSEKDLVFWQSVMRQLIVKGLLEKDLEEYGVLKLGEKARAFLKNPTPFSVPLNTIFIQNDDIIEEEYEGFANTSTPMGSPADEQLFDMLIALRTVTAKRENVPPYVIFSEAALMEMATTYPTKPETLQQIQGVSKGKVMRYGAPFIKLIAEYVEENDITPPELFTLKSAPQKHALNVYIIQNIDKRIPFKSMMSAKKLTHSELLYEIERIILSGTKLDLRYELDAHLDADDQAELHEYFKQTTTDDLSLAEQEFGEQYTIEQLGLARLKFLLDHTP